MLRGLRHGMFRSTVKVSFNVNTGGIAVDVSRDWGPERLQLMMSSRFFLSCVQLYLPVIYDDSPTKRVQFS